MTSGDLVQSAPIEPREIGVRALVAGALRDEERAIPPFFQPEYRWIDGNWDVNAMTLPAVGPGSDG